MYRKRALLAIICLVPALTQANLFFISPVGYVIQKIVDRRHRPQNDPHWDSFDPESREGKTRNAGGVDLNDQAQDDQVVGTIPNEIEDILEFLRNPEQFRKFGVKMPKGVLLVGPPGTGKTSTARELARKAGAFFINATGSEFVNTYVGVGAANVRKLFERARNVLKEGKYKSVIIFIDEIDALGAARSDRADGGNSEYNQTVNQLLSELDGFKREENILVLAATNFEDSLDQALLRPGRFDRRAYFKLPGLEDRLTILKHYCKNRPVDEAVDLANIAQRTDHMSGADLKNIVNEASIEAAREKGSTVITPQHFEVAVQKAEQRRNAQLRSLFRR